jgi:hypothetical protein
MGEKLEEFRENNLLFGCLRNDETEGHKGDNQKYGDTTAPNDRETEAENNK